MGILAVFVFILLGFKKPDPLVERARNDLRLRLEADKKRGLVHDYWEGPSSLRIVYTADRLSFDECGWDLPLDRAESIREHLRLELFKRASIAEIRIEGHADRRRVGACKDVTPYRDNLQLSQNRARAVYNALLGLDGFKKRDSLDDLIAGVAISPAPEGLEYLRALAMTGRLYVAGFGGTKPLDPSDRTPINRRVEIAVEFGPGEPGRALVAGARPDFEARVR